jgi:hypothetical protein
MTDRDAQFSALYLDLRIRGQQRFYDRRKREYQLAHRQAVVVRNGLLTLAVLSGVAGQFLHGGGRGILGILAALLTALAGAVTAFGTLIGFASLTKLYNDTALNLSGAEIDWEAGRPDRDLATALDRVERIFTTENGQWGQLGKHEPPLHAPLPGVDGR